jgi:hypothetical protein
MDKKTTKIWGIMRFWQMYQQKIIEVLEFCYSVAIFTLFISVLCLQIYTFTFDVTVYMNAKHMLNILK